MYFIFISALSCCTQMHRTKNIPLTDVRTEVKLENVWPNNRGDRVYYFYFCSVMDVLTEVKLKKRVAE